MNPETPTSDTLETDKTDDSSPCEKKFVTHLLGGEDIPYEDRIFREFFLSIQKVTDLEPASNHFCFSVPKTLSDS
jgi:hypothetical protein